MVYWVECAPASRWRRGAHHHFTRCPIGWGWALYRANGAASPRRDDGSGGRLREEARIVASVETMKELLEAGVHFGHQTRRWNPKMRPFIFTARNGIHILDLQQTAQRLNEAYRFVANTVANGDSILFVGTKKQAQEAIQEAAQDSGQLYVYQRWLVGMLT